MSVILALLLWIAPAHANMILVPAAAPPAAYPKLVWTDYGAHVNTASQLVWTDYGAHVE